MILQDEEEKINSLSGVTGRERTSVVPALDQTPRDCFVFLIKRTLPKSAFFTVTFDDLGNGGGNQYLPESIGGVFNEKKGYKEEENPN